jgi:hypothetical protein
MLQRHSSSLFGYLKNGGNPSMADVCKGLWGVIVVPIVLFVLRGVFNPKVDDSWYIARLLPDLET